MAQCPNCSAQLAITAAGCQTCGALFTDEGWHPLPTSPAEEQQAAERGRLVASAQVESSASDGRSANTALVIGVAISSSPIWLTLLSLPVCMLGASAACIAGPFLWFLLWPAYLVGFVVIAIALLSSKGRKSPGSGLPTAPKENPKQKPKSFLRCAKCAAEFGFDAVLCPKCGFRFGGTES